MNKIRLSLLRGVCQIPAYIACLNGFFKEEGIDASFKIAPTAWLIPQQLVNGDCEFAVIPWTRVAVAEKGEAPLRVVCGSGYEEAALVVQKHIQNSDVKSVAVPREGGMKDLTAQGLLDSVGWNDTHQLRYPSGDGAIIAFLGQGVDAASMVEPYATMFETLGIGRVVKRTGDIWQGAPGCSLSCAESLINQDPDLVRRIVRSYIRSVEFVVKNPDEAAKVAQPLIGVKASIISEAIRKNPPRIDGIRNTEVICKILQLMQSLGYVKEIPEGFADLRFMDEVEYSDAPLASVA